MGFELPAELPPAWLRWRKRRLREFLAFGMERENASRVADAEARGRARIALHVGFVAAASAELAIVPDGQGGERICLVIDPRKVPEDARDEAEAALNPDIALLA
jgi:hypothetical protein